ncbi:hypothetical protein [Spirillospora sp. NPDC048824]|uniref:hypothetical protein n=1 Tax=Spirillospora sp. NPDC048824 TaxID=3364526 RepID=UPI00371EFDEF
MTERGPFTGLRGAPDPADPPNPGDSGAPASRSQAAALPADLAAVRRTDAIIDSLAAWRAAGSAPRSAPGPADRPGGDRPEGDRAEAGRPRQADDPDPAVRLLRALIADVDDPGSESGAGSEAGPGPAPPRPPAPSGPGGPRRRGRGTIVALGVAGAVLASTGVAAAGSGATDHPSAAPAAPGTTASSDAADDTEKTVRADTDAGTYERPRPPVRPAPEPERRGPAPTPSGDPGDPGDREARPRPRLPFPFGPRPRHPDTPSTTIYSTPAAGTDGASDDDGDIGRQIDDIRRRTQERMNRHQNPYNRDD